MKTQVKPYQLLIKCEKVMRSCKTLAQIYIARNYCFMALTLVNESNLSHEEKQYFRNQCNCYIWNIKPEKIHDPSVDSKNDSQGSRSL